MRLVGKVLKIKRVSNRSYPPYRYELRLRVIDSVPPKDNNKNLPKFVTITRDFWREPKVGEKMILSESEVLTSIQIARFGDKLVTCLHRQAGSVTVLNPNRIEYTLYLGREMVYKGTESRPHIDIPRNLKGVKELKLKYGRKVLDRSVYIPPSLLTAKVEMDEYVFVKNPYLVLQIAPSHGGRIDKIFYRDGRSPWEYDEYYDFEDNKLIPFGIGVALKREKPLTEPLKPVPDENPLVWTGAYTEKNKNIFIKYILHPRYPIFTVELETPERWEDGHPHLRLDLPWIETITRELVFLTDTGFIRFWEYPKTRYLRPVEINESIDRPLIVKTCGLFLMFHSHQPNIKQLFHTSKGPMVRFIFPFEKRGDGFGIKLIGVLGEECFVKQNNVLLRITKELLLGYGAQVRMFGKKLLKTPLYMVKESKFTIEDWVRI